ncbi:MAG: hypothetical protein ACUVTE_05940 [Candidatus Bathycorpusculaceae bacterium]
MPQRMRIIIITMVTSIMLAAAILAFYPKSRRIPLTAAIIDQLGEHIPNPDFINNITSILTLLNFEVVYHHYKEVDVAFFKKLPMKNYGLIILRAHFALRNDSSTVDILTSEGYDERRYISEVNSGLLSIGRYYIQNLTNKSYFAITSSFISEEMEGNFPNSIIIAMGCWSIMPFSGYYFANPIAKAFIDKNAQVYIGWTNIVTSSDSDQEVAKLLKKFLTQNITLEQAIGETKTYSYKTEGGVITTRLSYFPNEAGKLTIEKIIPNKTP